MDLDIGRLVLAAAIIFLPMYFFQKLADWNTVNQKIDHPDMDEQKLKQIGTENRLVGFVAMIVSGIALLVSMGFMFLLVMVALYIVLIFPLFRIMRRKRK